MVLYAVVVAWLVAMVLDSRGRYHVREHVRAMAPWAATVAALALLARIA